MAMNRRPDLLIFASDHRSGVGVHHVIYNPIDSMAAHSLALLLCTFAAHGTMASKHEIPFVIEPQSKLYIEGTSNINSFECFCKDDFNRQSARVVPSSDGVSMSFLQTILMLRTAALDCDNSKMNRDLCDALKSEKYPYIKIELHNARITQGSFEKAGSDVVLLSNASITITNVTRKIQLVVRAKRLGSGRYRFFATKELLMTDFGIEPPTALLGLIKVRDAIRINFDLTMQTL